MTRIERTRSIPGARRRLPLALAPCPRHTDPLLHLLHFKALALSTSINFFLRYNNPQPPPSPCFPVLFTTAPSVRVGCIPLQLLAPCPRNTDPLPHIIHFTAVALPTYNKQQQWAWQVRITCQAFPDRQYQTQCKQYSNMIPKAHI